MLFRDNIFIPAAFAVGGLVSSVTAALTTISLVNETTCNGQTYVYEELAAFGYVPSDARDKFGDTIGGHRSSIAIDKNAWV